MGLYVTKHGVSIPLIHDADMLEMVEKGIRGGMCGVGSKTYAKIQDHSKESVMYLDANNLYGSQMMFDLPLSELKWIPESKLWNALKNPKIHAIFEVDLEYPKELHEYHKDYPLAPEKVTLKDGEKLCQTLSDKKIM